MGLSDFSCDFLIVVAVLGIESVDLESIIILLVLALLSFKDSLEDFLGRNPRTFECVLEAVFESDSFL